MQNGMKACSVAVVLGLWRGSSGARPSKVAETNLVAEKTRSVYEKDEGTQMNRRSA